MSTLDKVTTFFLRRCTLRMAVTTTMAIAPFVLGVLMIYFWAGEESNELGALFLVLTIVAVLIVWYLDRILFMDRTLPPCEHVQYSISKREIPTAPALPSRGELFAKRSHWFKDERNRAVILRGVNLGGSTKLPTTPDGATWNKHEFYDLENVSFVGRPFPLEEADMHLARLRAWGYTFLRFLITWEAVEPRAPGEYDMEYIAYLKAVIKKCDQHGLKVFIDPHQDVWSRWTGGDGAPAWTLESVGFDITKIYETGGAITHQEYGDPFPKMVWVTNYLRIAAATMFTVFFAGNTFAPKLKIQGEPAQDYLQRHYLDAMRLVANALKDETCVIGFDTLNEPSAGYVGRETALDSLKGEKLKSGWRLDAFHSMTLAVGIPLTVDFFDGPFLYSGKVTLNKNGVSIWKNGRDSCIWKNHGVWDFHPSTGEPRLLKPYYFKTDPNTNAPVSFLQEYLKPFWLKMAKTIREEIPDAMIFIEPDVNLTGDPHLEFPNLTDDQVGEGGMVWAKHYYDGMTLLMKDFNHHFGIDMVSQMPVVGHNIVIKSHSKALDKFDEEAATMGTEGCPVLIGETGIPFDLNNKLAFTTGNFDKQTAALDTTMRALEMSLKSFTLWNYTADNCNARGDNWNDEDLSIFSKDQITDKDDLNSGGRSLYAVIRPYASRVAGIPLKMSFDPYRIDHKFELRFKHDPTVTNSVSVLFVPIYQYPHGIHVSLSDGTWTVNWDEQTVKYKFADTTASEHWIIITRMSVHKESMANGFEVPLVALKNMGPRNQGDPNEELHTV